MSATPWINFSPKMGGFLCSRCNESYKLGPFDDFEHCARAFMMKHSACTPFGLGFALIESSEPIPEPVILDELTQPVDVEIGLEVQDGRFHREGEIFKMTKEDVTGYLYVKKVEGNTLTVREATKQEIFFYVTIPSFFRKYFVALQVMVLKMINKLIKPKDQENVD